MSTRPDAPASAARAIPHGTGIRALAGAADPKTRKESAYLVVLLLWRGRLAAMAPAWKVGWGSLPLAGSSPVFSAWCVAPAGR